MSKKFCCPNCFGDYGLEKSIFPSLNAQIGNCNFCLSTNVDVLTPSLLVDSFQPLVEIYKKDNNGKPLAELLKKDWLLFDNRDLSNNSIIDLLDDILGIKGISQEKFSLSNSYKSDKLESWNKFREEIRYKNRWFLEDIIDLEQLGSLLTNLHAVDLPKKWYRARLGKYNEFFELQQMSSPPKNLSTFGRANPAGIPYLYLASNKETALAEVRPQNKENATIAEFLIEDLLAVDLRNPRKHISPFILQDTEKIGELSVELPFLEILGQELTRPVLPFEAAINYTPTQYLCEFIKSKNYDGVIYSSSVSDGFNFALFDQNKAKSVTVEHYVANVSVSCVSYSG